MDQPHPADQVAHLAALDVANEVPGEGVAKPLLLGEERIGPVLADERNPTVPERRQVVRLDVLRRGQDLGVRADLARAHGRGSTR